MSLLAWLKELEDEQRKAKKALREHSRWATNYLIPLFGPDSQDAGKMSIAALQQGFHREKYINVEWRRTVLKKINEIRADHLQEPQMSRGWIICVLDMLVMSWAVDHKSLLGGSAWAGGIAGMAMFLNGIAVLYATRPAKESQKT